MNGLKNKAFFVCAERAFELLTMLHVIEHIKNDKMALREIYRVLKKDGTALIVTPNANRFTKLYSVARGVHNSVFWQFIAVLLLKRRCSS